MTEVEANSGLKAIENWMNEILATRDKMQTEVYLTTFVDKFTYKLLKENPDTSKIKPTDLGKSLGCVKARGFYDTYPSDVSIRKFETWLANIPEFKAKWNSTVAFLDEVKSFETLKGKLTENEQTIDTKIDIIVKELHDNNIHYLHKIAKDGTPDADIRFRLPEKYFIMTDSERMHVLCNTLPPCYGVYNGRIVFNYDGYFVGGATSVWVSRFTMLKRQKKQVVEAPVRGQDASELQLDLYNYAYRCDALMREKIGLKTEFNPKYIFFNKSESLSCNNEIVKRITKYYNDDIKGIDLRTNTPLAESYFILVGWLFSPAEREQRLVGCFECKTSGIGKTSFIKCLCDRVDVVFGSVSQPNGNANTFSFSPCFAQGPDIVNIDDPCKGTADIMSYIGNVVSNKEAQVELKGENRYTLRGLDTKVYVSTNVPIYIKNDTTNFMTSKLFVLKANDTLQDSVGASRICDYISGCDKKTVEEFLSYCVEQYKEHGSEFIKSHMGVYIDKEEEKDLFEDMIDYDAVRNAAIGRTSLIECVRGDMHRDERDNVHNDVVNKCWNMICKHIQTQWGDVAKEAVCSVPRDNPIYAVGSRPSKSRCKNYIITKALQEMLLDRLSAIDGSDGISLPSYKGSIDELM